ncbi:MAG: phosphomannomutase/phosphoglucomutase [Bacteriovoracia bacterium]
MKVNASIFREYDIRGIAATDLSAEFAENLGLAYARFLREQLPQQKQFNVSVGRDCRLTGDLLANALILGMRKGGLNVVSIGVCPTPLTYFSLFELSLDGGIMVTGSHNASEYNGFKICVGRSTIHGEQIQVLRKYMEQGTPPAAEMGSFRETNLIPEYIDYVAARFPGLQKKKIVLDAGNGTASTVAPELFKRLGADVVPLYCELDGRFPNHHPDPTVPENLQDLIAAVKREKADFGVGFDGDSDRIGLVDENGRIVYGDELMIIFSRDILKSIPGSTIISEVKCSHRLYEDIAKHGGNPIMWKTGHSLIKSKMKETKAALAGEMSGHIFFADRYFGFDDAIYAAVRVFEISSKTNQKISSLISDLPQVVATPEIRVDCEEDRKFALVAETKRLLSQSFKTIDIDGVRVNFTGGWGLVRASNTSPVLVLRFEAPDEAKMIEFKTTVYTALNTAAKTVGHPAISQASGAHGH